MDKKKDAMQYYQQGLSGIHDNKFDKASISYTRAIKFDKANLQHHLGIALAKGEQEKHESASFLYKIFLIMDPQNAVAYYNYGFILDVQGKIDESIEMYKKALDFNPHDADGYYNLAIMLTTKENYEEAQKHYLKALELQPSDTYKVLNCFGYSYCLQGEFAKARAELQRSIDLNGKYLFAYCNMSLVLFCEKLCEEACRNFEEGIKVLEGDKGVETRIIKDIIASYTGEKIRLEAKLNGNEETMDEENTTLLKTLIHALVNIINLLTQQQQYNTEETLREYFVLLLLFVYILE